MVSARVQAGAFMPRDLEYASWLEGSCISVPSLVIHGECDQLVPLERSTALTQHWDQAQLENFVHAGGHMMPTCTGDFRDSLRTFLTKQQQQQ